MIPENQGHKEDRGAQPSVEPAMEDALPAVDEGLPEEEDGGEKKSGMMQELYEWAETLMLAMLCVVLVFTFVARTVIVDGPSMIPTLLDRDALVVTRLTGDPEPGDIVAVTKLSAIDRPLIKRVIAVGGQTIEIDADTGDVTVDGKLLDEPYINEHILPDPYYAEEFPLTVPEGSLFIMGDNRNNSWDSRSSLGVVDRQHVLGKVVFRYMPLDSIGIPE